MNSLLENSCDLSDDDDEEIELLVEEGQTPILIRQKSKKSVKSSRDNSDFGFSNNSSKHFTLSDEDCESQSSQRDSFSLGAGCLPCTPKSGKKNLEKISKQICKQFYSSNWCCGDVANMVKKTTKKTLNFILFYLSCK